MARHQDSRDVAVGIVAAASSATIIRGALAANAGSANGMRSDVRRSRPLTEFDWNLPHLIASQGIPWWWPILHRLAQGDCSVVSKRTAILALRCDSPFP